MGDVEYKDGIDLGIDEFYKKLIGENLFPKTSLPNLEDLQENVKNFTEQGDDVLILALSSGISGTYNAIANIFQSNDKVRVVDTLTAVGGIRILVEEINKYRDKPIDFIVEKVKALIPKVKINFKGDCYE